MIRYFVFLIYLVLIRECNGNVDPSNNSTQGGTTVSAHTSNATTSNTKASAFTSTDPTTITTTRTGTTNETTTNASSTAHASTTVALSTTTGPSVVATSVHTHPQTTTPRLSTPIISKNITTTINGTQTTIPTVPGQGPDIGAIVGGVVGGVLFIILAISLAIIFYRFYKGRKLPRKLFMGMHIRKRVTRLIEIQKFNDVLPLLLHNSAFPLLEEFAALTEHCPTIKNKNLIAMKEENLLKNRYADVLPFDGTRVILEGNRYINASFIRGYKHQKEYIAAQAPMGDEDRRIRGKYSTMDDFFEMIWQQNPKCAQYWPNEIGQAVQHGVFTVFLLKQNDFGSHWSRLLGIRRSGQARILLQYHYKQWSDMRSTDEQELLHFITTVRSHVRNSCPKSPVLVHCSAGVGRTGVFITLDILLQQIRHRNLIDIPACVFALRHQRIRMVQTEEQYIMVYKAMGFAIKDHFECKDKDTNYDYIMV